MVIFKLTNYLPAVNRCRVNCIKFRLIGTPSTKQEYTPLSSDVAIQKCNIFCSSIPTLAVFEQVWFIMVSSFLTQIMSVEFNDLYGLDWII